MKVNLNPISGLVCIKSKFMIVCTVNTMKIIKKVEFIGQNQVFSAFSHPKVLMTGFAKMAITSKIMVGLAPERS